MGPRLSLLFGTSLLATSCTLYAQGLLSAPEMKAPSHSWTNGDGSSRLMLEFAGGWDPLAGASKRDLGARWNIELGGGYRLDRRFGVLAEYTYNRFGSRGTVSDSVFTDIPYYPALSAGIGGLVHIWSVGLTPAISIWRGERVGLDLIGGGAFYRKLAIFSDANCGNAGVATCPVHPSGQYRRSNNAGGANLGLRVAHTIVESGRAKLFAQARYTWIDNTPDPNNVEYPPVNRRTGFFPIALGFGW